VQDAVGKVKVLEAGIYTLWVRCRDWYPSHSPGLFNVLVDGKLSSVEFGQAQDEQWQWVNGGEFELKRGEIELRIKDKTGWWARVDALVLASKNFEPSNEIGTLKMQRDKYCGSNKVSEQIKHYDVVVVGAGSAGLGAAIAAARGGAKVALIQDRPYLGGNASNEIKVPPMGYIGSPPDKVNVTGIAEEIYPVQGWSNFGDSKLYEKIVRSEKNIALFLNTRAIGVQMKSKVHIDAVSCMNIHTNEKMIMRAPLFIDTTGHGWIGYYAGAEYRQGTEARAEFGETLAPLKASDDTMGNSLYKINFEKFKTAMPFETPAWAYQWKSKADFDGASVQRDDQVIRPVMFDEATEGKGRSVTRMGGGFTWFMEYGGVLDTIKDAEKIRDELFRIHLGLWGYQKNIEKQKEYENYKMVWMNYVPGVRESRRLMGDYIMTQKDFDDETIHPDTVAFTDWGIDDHHPYGFFTKGIDAIHVYKGRRVSIPYRSLYSKNIDNLFMAGRCMSATHMALAGVRVQRPMTATGQVVGSAAAIAIKHKCDPRGIYLNHLNELQQRLLRDGCYLMGVKNQDEKDLALKATTDTPAIVDGWNRDNASTSKAVVWRSKPIELKFGHEVDLSEVHLSLADCHHSVEFSLEGLFEDSWRTIMVQDFEEKRRRYVLNFATVRVSGLKLILKRSSGPVAICEVRAYE